MIDSVYVIANNLVLMEKHWSIPIPDRKIIDKIKTSSGTVTKCLIDNKYLIKNSTQNSEINFIALISNEACTNSSLSFILTALQQVRTVFESYIGFLTAIKIQENDVILFQVLSEMFDAGYPLIVDVDQLKEIILPPTMLNNLMDSITSIGRAKDVVPEGRSQISVKASSLLNNLTSRSSSHESSSISSESSHNSNSNSSNTSSFLSRNDSELNIDVLEKFSCIINKNGQIIKAEIFGEISANSKFSVSDNNNNKNFAHVNPTPTFFISFINPMILTEQAGCNLALSSKINKIRWRDDKTFIFKSTLGNRSHTLATYHLIGSDRGIPIQQIARAMPVNVNSSINFYEDRGILLLTVNNRTLAGSGNIAAKVQPIQDVVISCILPKFVTSCSVIEEGTLSNTSSVSGGPNAKSAITNSLASRLTGSSNPSSLSTFDTTSKCLEWKIGKLLHGKPVSCKFKMIADLKHSKASHINQQHALNNNDDFLLGRNISIKVDFKVDQYTMSGIKLNRIDMNMGKGDAKLFKTINYSCYSGNVDFRV